MSEPENIPPVIPLAPGKAYDALWALPLDDDPEYEIVEEDPDFAPDVDDPSEAHLGPDSGDQRLHLSGSAADHLSSVHSATIPADSRPTAPPPGAQPPPPPGSGSEHLSVAPGFGALLGGVHSDGFVPKIEAQVVSDTAHGGPPKLRFQIGTRLLGRPVWHEHSEAFEQARQYLQIMGAFPVRVAGLLFDGWKGVEDEDRIVKHFGKAKVFQVLRSDLCPDRKRVRVLSNPFLTKGSRRWEAKGWPVWRKAWDVVLGPIVLHEWCRHRGVVLLGVDFLFWAEKLIGVEVEPGWEYRNLGVGVVPSWKGDGGGGESPVSIELVQVIPDRPGLPRWRQAIDFVSEIEKLVAACSAKGIAVSLRLIYPFWAAGAESCRPWPDRSRVQRSLRHARDLRQHIGDRGWSGNPPIRLTFLNGSDYAHPGTWEFAEIQGQFGGVNTAFSPEKKGG